MVNAHADLPVCIWMQSQQQTQFLLGNRMGYPPNIGSSNEMLKSCQELLLRAVFKRT